MTDLESAAIERRMEIFVLAAGAAAAIASGAGWGWRAGLSAAIGLLLCWMNFRWLREGAAALVQIGAAQAEATRVKVPSGLRAKFFGRIILLLVATYAILVWLRLPAVAFLCGLTAVFPAILLELGYELAHGQHRWTQSKSDS